MTIEEVITEAVLAVYGEPELAEHIYLDFKHRRKPQKAHPDKPDWWGGWVCEFKLCPI
ncbi:MAG: hypothetical protein JJU05_01585 [Verrucomicrobia bacterium]|nr:hypothetical protein [Verrucomicrobiota bacterium]MCH8528254.1 hypothetical protein [Kiritimatiellia bacterium]